MCHLMMEVAMPNFCVSKDAQSKSRDHEVHDLDFGCSFLPAPANRIDLGSYSSCRGAVAAAKQHYNDVNGCYYCANACHTT
jgi:hypothetical protein